MIGLLRALPLVYRFGIVGITVLSILGGLWYIKKTIYENGYKACSIIYERDKIEKERLAREQIIELEKKYRDKSKSLDEIGTNDSVGPAVEFAIDSLHDVHD